jgi:bacillithiol system protein YtxJ
MWHALTDLQQLDQLTQASYLKAQLLFKHSTRCSISRVALGRFDRLPASQEQGDFHLLDLLQYRPIAQQITERFGIPHESPQALIIKNGGCIYHANHLDIEPDEIYAQLDKTA